jgi:hypothetical protein
MVNTNWNMQGLAPEPGLRMDFRFEYIDQDQPRAGSGKVPFGQIRRHHDEIRTINRNYIVTLDYTVSADWGVVATIPLVDRSHAHIHNHGGARLLEQWDFRELGEMQVLGRRQWMNESASAQTLSFFGVNFGLKLPTGDFDVRNRNGDLAERSLQPGSGTTDALLGGFYSHVMPELSTSCLCKAWPKCRWLSESTTSPVSDSHSMRAFDMSSRTPWVSAATERAESRPRRGTRSRAGRHWRQFRFVSPGASYVIAPKTQIYAFVQKPIYQYVNGVQITADWSLLVGLSSRF